MTERYEEDSLPGMEQRELLEGMTPDQIVDVILSNGETVSEIERFMNLANEVLEGVHGLSVEQVLQQREKENGTA